MLCHDPWAGRGITLRCSLPPCVPLRDRACLGLAAFASCLLELEVHALFPWGFLGDLVCGRLRQLQLSAEAPGGEGLSLVVRGSFIPGDLYAYSLIVLGIFGKF